MKLVPDGTFFNENFERHVIEGHVIFRVKPRHRPHLITLDFNSKVWCCLAQFLYIICVCVGGWVGRGLSGRGGG